MHDWRMTVRRRALPLSLTIAAGAALAACNIGGNSGSDSDRSSGSTGTASFAVTDAPVDGVNQVWVTFSRIALQPASGERIHLDLDEPRQIDLLTLQGDNAEVLIEEAELPAGQYNWIRLYVVGGFPDSYVVHNEGGEIGLYVPGNHPPSRNPNQRWLQLSSPFVVPAGDHADFTIDVDLRKALVYKNTTASPEPYYMIRPSLRIVDNRETGTLWGVVDEALVTDNSCANDPNSGAGNAVYVYRGAEATPGDVYLDEDGEVQQRQGLAHPVTTANVRQKETDEGMRYSYTVGFLTAGDYTVAFTCQGLEDAPDEDNMDIVSFGPVHNVTITAGDRTRQDFSIVD